LLIRSGSVERTPELISRKMLRRSLREGYSNKIKLIPASCRDSDIS
jgi:hypothetical protein